MVTTWNQSFANPDAETGDMTGWTHRVRSMGVSSAVSGAAKIQGNYFFMGLTNSIAESLQVFSLDVHSGLVTAVDSGLVEMTWRCKQSAFEADGDPGGIYIRALDNSLATIGFIVSSMIAPNSVWVDNILRTLLPVGTRVVHAGMFALRHIGTNNDARFDVFSAYYQIPWDTVKNKGDLTVTNPKAESGITGWTVFTGNFASANRSQLDPHTPSFWISSQNNVTTPVAYQDLDLWSVVGSQAINSGFVYAVWRYNWAIFANENDAGGLNAKFMNPALDTVIHSGPGPLMEYVQFASSYTAAAQVTQVPSGARYMRLEAMGLLRTGAAVDFYFDNVSAYLLVDSGYMLSEQPSPGGVATKRSFPGESANRLWPTVVSRLEPVV